MALVNQDQLLGAIIPDVYISKIILETVGGTHIQKEENPHIDLGKTPKKEKDLLTGKLVTPRLRPNIIPPAPINIPRLVAGPIPFRKSTEEKLSVTVELILKEKLDNGLIGTWFKNQNFSKYIRLKVIQSKKAALTQAASTNRGSLLMLSRNQLMPVSKIQQKTLINDLQVRLGVPHKEAALREIDNAIESRVLNVQHDIIGDTTKLTTQYTDVDEDGNTIVSFVFRTKFELPTQTPEHLSYFAFSYLDLYEMAKDYNMKLDSRLISEPIGKVISDIVFENGEIIGQSFAYTDSSGKLWVGPIDETSTGESFGITKDGTRIPITRTLVGNSKIQDFRDFKDLDRLVLDFSVVENEILNTKLTGPRKDKLDIKVFEACFSDLNLARDDEGRCRYFFSVNMRKLLALNGAYGRLFANPTTGKSALLESSIVSLKLLRRRVKGSPEIGSVANNAELFDSNQIDELMLTTGERSWKNLIEKNTSKASIREIKSVFVQGFEGGQDLSDIRHFTGVDKQIADETDGYYVYGIEMEVSDPSFVYLRNKVGDLRKAREGLQRYFTEATKLESERTLVATDNPHVDFPGETKLDKSTLIPGNFNPLLNRFTQRFINEQIAKYGTDENAVTPWSTAVKTYVDLLELFTPNPETVPFEKFEKSLFYFTHPATGNPSGILKLLNLIDTLETNLSKVVGGPAASSLPSSTGGRPIATLGVLANSSATLVRISNKQNIAIKTFKVTKFFDNVFNGSVPKAIGYDFLDINTRDSLTGLKTITGEEFAQRVERETNHYFVKPLNTKPDISIKLKDQDYTKGDSLDNTSFSYLTPARIRLQDKFNIVRLGNSPTPLTNKMQMAHLDLSIKSFNASLAPIKNKSVVSVKAPTDKLTKSIVDDVYNLMVKVNVEPVFKIQKKPVPIVNIPTEKLETRPNVTIDPIVDDNSVCKFDDDIIKEVKNTNPTPVLLELSRRLDLTPGRASKKPLTLSSKGNIIGGEKLSIKMFDITSRDGLINKVLQDGKLHRAESFFQGARHNTSLHDAMIALPNQVKSLYLSRTQPQIVRKNVFTLPTDPIKDPEQKTEFRLSYQMINTVQVFNGYEKSIDGELLLKKPIWMPLTVFSYNQATGEAMLCRLKAYENKVIGITRDKGLELPLFDEYFILKPQNDTAGLELPKVVPPPVKAPLPPPVIVKTVERPKILEIIDTKPVRLNLIEENRNQLSIRTEYISNNIVTHNVPVRVQPTVTVNPTAPITQTNTSIRNIIGGRSGTGRF